MQREKASMAAVKEEERSGEKMYSQRERRRMAHRLHHTHTYIHASCVCAAAVAVCTVVGAVVVCRSNSSSRSRSGFRSSERGGQEEEEMEAGPGEEDD